MFNWLKEIFSAPTKETTIMAGTTHTTMGDIVGNPIPFKPFEAIETGRLNSKEPNKSNIPKSEPYDGGCGGFGGGHELPIEFDIPDTTAIEIITNFDLI